eukprot:1414654-Pyramimonas_sp.AAC.1
MMGISAKIRRAPGSHHPGCPMSTKAAETSTLAKFAMHMLRQNVHAVPMGAELLAAGDALQEWKHIARTVSFCHALFIVASASFSCLSCLLSRPILITTCVRRGGGAGLDPDTC